MSKPTMNIQILMEMRAEIDQAIRECITLHGGYDAEFLLIDQAKEQLIQMTGKGGSTRGHGEQAIIQLIKEFDTTKDWPLSKFMAEYVAVDN